MILCMFSAIFCRILALKNIYDLVVFFLRFDSRPHKNNLKNFHVYELLQDQKQISSNYGQIVILKKLWHCCLFNSHGGLQRRIDKPLFKPLKGIVSCVCKKLTGSNSIEYIYICIYLYWLICCVVCVIIKNCNIQKNDFLSII